MIELARVRVVSGACEVLRLRKTRFSYCWRVHKMVMASPYGAVLVDRPSLCPADLLCPTDLLCPADLLCPVEAQVAIEPPDSLKNRCVRISESARQVMCVTTTIGDISEKSGSEVWSGRGMTELSPIFGNLGRLVNRHLEKGNLGGRLVRTEASLVE